jgi:rod shape-determining protein MreB
MTDSNKNKGVLYLGIDLGTSRTSVSSSNGERATLSSFVGYPKDAVAKKALGADVLFGDEALAKRMSVDLYRPLSAGVIQDGADTTHGKGDKEGNLRAAADLIKEIIARAKPRSDELLYAVIGAPAEASIHNKEAILDAARGSVDSVMLCSEPFAVAYGLDMLEDVLVIDIGAGTVDLCRMHGTMPDESDQLTLTCGGDFVDRAFAERLEATLEGARFSPKMVKDAKERFASVADGMEPAIVNFPVNGKPTTFDVTEQLREACRLIIPPIVEGLGKLVASFDPEFQDRLKDRVLLAGGGSQIRGLDTAIQAAMHEMLGSGKVQRIEEPLYGGANGALKIAHDMPAEYWEQLK